MSWRRIWLFGLACLFLAGVAGCGNVAPTIGSSTVPSPLVGASPSPAITAGPSLAPAAPSATRTLPVPTSAPTASQAPTATPQPPAQANPGAVRLQLERVAAGLDVPVGITHAGDGSGRLFVVEKPGRIRIVQGGVVRDPPYLDITDRVGSSGSEQGLLGLAFHPAFARNSFFYVYYTDRQGNTVVSRFSAGPSPDQADPATELRILGVDQPAANHNGGQLAFGPDGYLYIGLGDGGGEGDPFHTGQDRQSLLAKTLRLDVDHGQPYSVPADNPFVTEANTRHETWAMGLRNPWRFSFDRLTGDLYIADVGQDRFEEVDFQRAGQPGGQNYGWSIMEGKHCYPESAQCDRTGLTLPVVEYDHSQGCSITGGYVYRGRQFPSLAGIYVYGDYCSGRIWGMAPDGSGGWQVAELARASMRLSSFGEDESGELYLVDMGRGELLRLVVQPAP